MVEYLSGNRIQGSSTKLSAPPQTSWKELARATAGSGGSSSITTSTFTAKDNMMILYNSIGADPQIRVGYNTIDTGGNYSQKYSEDYGTAGTFTSSPHNAYWYVNGGAGASGTEHVFGVIKCFNKATREKYCILQSVDNADGTGASTVTGAYERGMKWSNTSNQINIVRMFSSGTMAEGSEIVVIGYDNDEADSGSNFWQVLKTAELTSASTTFSSGQISTTKKYLWIQVEYDQTSGGGVGIMKGGTGGTFGLGSIMSTRFSHDGAAAQSQESVSYGIVSPSSDGSSRVFVNCFIINPSGHEKLGISDGSDMASTGSATAPDRTQGAFKWANTSAQLDIFNFSGADGGNLNNGKITIWGHD